MEFGKHIKTGAWGLADKSLPMVFGLGYIFLVIRLLPPVEFGTYVLLQNLFLLIVALATSLALQPLIKYAAGEEHIAPIVGAGSMLYGTALLAVSIVLIAARHPLGELFNAPSFAELVWYLPVMFLVSSVRSISTALLQSKVRMREIFFINAIYFLGSLAAIYLVFRDPASRTANTILLINTVSLLASSLVGAIIIHRMFPGLTARREPGREQRMERDGSLLGIFWAYGKYSFGASAAYTLYSQADSYIIAGFLGPIEVAVYNAAKTFTRVFDVLFQLIVNLLFPISSRYAAEKNTGELVALSEKSIFMFTLGIIPVAAALWLFAPFLVQFYGGKYPEAVGLIRIFALSGVALPVLGITSSILYGLGKMRQVFAVSSLNTLLAVALMLAGVWMFGLPGAAWSYVLITFMMAGTYYYTFSRYSGLSVGLGNVLARYQDVLNYFKKSV